MDWSELEALNLDTDVAAAAAGLDAPPRQPQFVIDSNRFLSRAAKDRLKQSRRGIKALIRPENAECVLPHLPEQGDHLHAILRGDFVLADLIPVIIAHRGALTALHIATLGLSTANAEMLTRLKAQSLAPSITIVCSHYFQQVDKTTVFREVSARLDGKARLIVTRNHAKVICLPTVAGENFVIEGSANLRSSDNLEQITIFNDAELLAWHVAWMEQLATTT